MRERVDRWLDSDLVGIAATLYTFGVLAISLAVFRFGGPIAGIVVAVALWIPMVLFAIQGRGKPPAALEAVRADGRNGHRILVIANQGLEDPALRAEVCRRGEHASTEVLIVAPVAASSGLRELADDVDAELAHARARIESAVQELAEAGVSAGGHADIADPMEALLDGLREFPPNEVVMIPGRESDWARAGDLSSRVRVEVGLPVTVIEASEVP